MECVWDAAFLQHAGQLPPELLDIIRDGSNDRYLDAITRASLDPRHTSTLFAYCEDIFPHVCATLRRHGSLASSVATLGRVVPLAPYLMPYAQRLLSSERYDLSASINSEDDLSYLLGLFRLLSHDRQAIKPYIKPTMISRLLESSSRAIVYLAIRILQIYFSGADDWFEQMVERHLGKDTPDNAILGTGDDITIDYRFLTLWEEDRVRRMARLVENARSQIASFPAPSPRVLPGHAFDEATVVIGGICLPREASGGSQAEHFVHVPSARSNIQRLGSALKSSRPILLSGPAGCGKTLLARYAANELGALDSMITLHLNEQSDAKLLTGIYTTGDTPGSFVWKPGVLTQAVEEGRWVLIEDLDRAPNEIIGTLLPLIEKRELVIPNRKQTIHATHNFRILATVRSNTNHRGEKVRPLAHLLGARHWQSVEVESPSIEELQQIAHQLHPSLAPLLPQFIAVYERLAAARQTGSKNVGTGVLRSVSPREFLKWCGRVTRVLQQKDTFTSQDLDNIFLEALDCFVGALANETAREDMAAGIAEQLRIDPQRRDYLVEGRDVKYVVSKSTISVGRYDLPRLHESRKGDQDSFSTNPHTCRMLERVASGIVNREPLLLVGETGVGKTTAIQHLATHVGKKLVPFNLSQQSEAGDLLGGFKPVNARSIIIPIKDEFDELFASSFSQSKNQRFLQILGKQMSKGNWKAVCKLWRQALAMVDNQMRPSEPRAGEAPNKKRKVESKVLPDASRWEAFAERLSDLERRLAAGENAFAFKFVEGTIVKAVRNGDWVLLDEINLASPDTLESIADLFDSGSPSLLLTESGSVERVDAHPAFRVFAAMNPATDVGKKDLPPGIRSRFTELYVESPDKDIKSLQSIVRSYLRQESASDAAIALDVSTLYQKIVGLANQNRLVDGAGQKPHFSVRTLTRTLSYAKYIAPQCSLRRALFEGFHMSFLTFLDAESSALVEPLLEQHLLGKRTNAHAELSKALRRPNDGAVYVQGYPGSKHWIRQGPLPVEEQPHYILTPFIRRNLENLVRASSTRKFPVLIQGPTSSGKTSMIEYLAKRSGHKFVRINNHEHTDLQEYLGTYISDAEGRLQFQEGILIKALREGHWVVLDELNLAPTDVLEALNRLLDDNRELLIPETQEVVRPHEEFMLFATQNPAGLYGGRKTLSRAFRNRFLELHFDDIPIDELQEILHKRTELPESRCKRIVSVYRELSVLRQESRMFEQRSFATLRDLFRWALRPNDTIEQLAANGFMLLGERVRKAEERKTLKEVIEKVMSANGPRVRISEEALYAAESLEIIRYEQAVGSRGVVWTKAMRRLYTLVSRAIQNNEPVLLVGETGCGKTTVCQMLAEAFNTTLHTINAHQNTETGDIVGSQRPVRNRAATENSLRQCLIFSALLQHLDTAGAQSTEALLEMYDRALAAFSAEDRTAYTHSPEFAEIQSLRTRANALFEWVDGSLVQAMRDGTFFLLDEISLADDSVLERINSVLESQRSILLAEKGSLDSYVMAAEGFQFFATMNPGGDYGKRELSPALRNRFTEIWVPPLDDTEDITQIVSSKLRNAAKPFATAIVAFAQWFNRQYNTSAASSISIRDALSWVEFINTVENIDSGAAVIHGAAMVYIDTLGANPAGLMTMTASSLDQERQKCLLQLSQLLQADAGAMYGTEIAIEVQPDRFNIGRFALPRHVSEDLHDYAFSFDPKTTRINAMRVVRALQLRKPVLLEGNPGVGKTALINAIANAANYPLTRINLSEQTDLIDLFGSDVPLEGADGGTFTWRDAPFLRAMKNGEWVLLDEMNLASQSVLEGLNACLDHRGEVFVPELGQSFTRHPGFRLFAAQNPHHQGGGRKGLPASFVNRFTVVYADAFRPADLMLISRQLFPTVNPEAIAKMISFVEQLEHEVVQRKRIGATGGPWEFNLRDVTRWLAMASSDKALLRSGTQRDWVDFLFTQRFRSTIDRAYVGALFDKLFEQREPASDLFPFMSADAVQIGLGMIPRDKIFGSTHQLNQTTPRAHLTAAQSVLLCVQQAWPVILTGASGAGKTALVERIAAAVGAQVTTIALNADSDSIDLIGGFEQEDPLRRKVQMVERARALLTAYVKTNGIGTVPQDLLALFDRSGDAVPIASVDASESDAELASIRELLHRRQEQDHRVNKARFEWVDGLLIEALQQGKWLILDNANLCSPSVLDRLNSLLEPNGRLMLNEHSADDGSPRTIIPHPDFRVFLLYDPRFGELSRAMRNRAVEIYLSSDALLGSNTDPNFLHPESAVARFRYLQMLASDMEHADTNSDVSMVLADHLGLVDMPLMKRFNSQLHAGLFELSTFTRAGVEQSFNAATEVIVQRSNLSAVEHNTVLDGAQVSTDHARVQVSRPAPSVSTSLANGKSPKQTLHPLNNQAAVRSLQSSSFDPFAAAFRFDASVHSMSLLASTKTLQASAPCVAALRTIERALPVAGKRASSWDKSSLLVDALHSSLEKLRASDNTRGFSSVPIQGERRAMAYLFTTLAVVLRYLEAGPLDLVTLATYLAAAWRKIEKLIRGAPSDRGAQYLASLAHMRPGTDKDFLMQSSCMALWSTFKPVVPATTEQMSILIDFEALLEQFDRLCQTFRLPLAAMVDLRISISRVLTFTDSSGQDLSPISEELRKALSLSWVDPFEHDLVHEAHFAGFFRQLIVRFALLKFEGYQVSTKDLAMAELFAGHSTKSSILHLQMSPSTTASDCSQVLELVARPVISTPEADSTGADSSLQQRLRSTGGVSISCISLLEDEISVLGRILASQPHRLYGGDVELLDHALNSLTRQTLEALLRIDCGDELRDTTQQLVNLLESGIGEARSDTSVVLSGLPKVEQMAAAVLKLRDVVVYLVTQHESGSAGLSAASAAWTSFSVACLQLYIPTSPFDPALDARFNAAAHDTMTKHLSDQAEALNTFRHGLTGVADTIRMRILKDDLAAIGPAPSIEQVSRPEVSRFADLLSELNALQRIISQTHSEKTSSMVPMTESSLSNFASIRNRLHQNYRDYHDFVGPIVAFIDCLFVAQHLTLKHDNLQSEIASRAGQAALVPFAGASWENWSADTYFVDAALATHDLQQRLYWLDVVAVRSSFMPLSQRSPDVVQAVEQVLYSFYLQWKHELAVGQKKMAVKSSLYKYKGQEDVDTEPTEEDFTKFFPPDDTGVGEHVAAQSTHNVQDCAPRLAALHGRIFIPQAPINSSMLGLLEAYASLSGQQSQVQAINEATAPALIYAISRLRTELSGEQDHRSFNIYKDPSVGQVKKLLEVVKRISSKFEQLHEAFPEHATPDEVRRICAEVLQMPRKTPLAQFFPQLERLHSAVAQWQTIASREYSVVTEIDLLSDTIIGWRQLELSSWAGLFDAVSQQAETDAISWWFIAYENIMASISRESDNESSDQQDLINLLETLTSFIMASGLGEYAARLKILKGFEAHLRVHKALNPQHGIRLSALQNFIAYFDRFVPNIEQVLKDGRDKLDNEVKKVIQLASWRDRNIEVLRQSASASHRKLLRLVKKFRLLLAQPVTPYIDQTKLQNNDEILATGTRQAEELPKRDLRGSGDLLELAGWLDRPARFRNVEATSSTIRTRIDAVLREIDLTDSLKTFDGDLKQSIKEMQKATPATLTEENKPVVAHLKTRKRSLLANVLRDMRAMGFKTSMSDSTLAKQQSLSTVFSYVPVLDHIDASKDICEARNSFYQLLGIMPSCRDAARKHSDDITPAEAARSLSLLESVLDTSIAHHTASAVAVQQFRRLEQVSRQVRSFAHCKDPEPGAEHESSPTGEHYQASVLRSVLYTARDILQKQASLSGKNYAELISKITSEAARLSEILSVLNEGPAMPPGILDSAQRKVCEDFATFLSELQTILEDEIADHPECGPVLSNIVRWARTRESSEKSHVNGHLRLRSSEWVRTLLETLDVMLVAVQTVGAERRKSGKDAEPPSLVDQQATLHRMWTALQPDAVTEKVTFVLSSLPDVLFEADTTLATLADVANMVYPIIDAFVAAAGDVLANFIQWYEQLNQTGYSLALSFNQLAERGLCTPSEKQAESPGAKAELESGTGLGEGEGAEDISKDIGDDEDLSGLNEQERSESKPDDMQDEKDAVDMADEEFEGDVGEASSEAGSDDGKDEDGSDQASDIEEEAGAGDIGEEGVDEKIWDGEAESGEDKQQNEGRRGKPQKGDDTTAAESQPQETVSEDEEESTDAPEDVGEKVEADQPASDIVDPHAKNEDNLDLPEDMDMNGDQQAVVDRSDSDSAFSDEEGGPEEGSNDMDVDVEAGAQEAEEEQQDGSENDEGMDLMEQAPSDEAIEGEHEEENISPTAQDQRQNPEDAVDMEATYAGNGSGPEPAGDASKQGTGQGSEMNEPDPASPPSNDIEAGTAGQEGQGEMMGDAATDTKEKQLTSTFRQLGDMLEQWYEQHRDIREGKAGEDVDQTAKQDLSTTQFEHLPDENTEADAQVLGSAPMDQSAPLNKSNAMPMDGDEPAVDRQMDDKTDNEKGYRQETPQELPDDNNLGPEGPQIAQSSTLVGEQTAEHNPPDTVDDDIAMQDFDEVEGVDTQLTNTHISHENFEPQLSIDTARQLWAQHEERTRNLALILTEHLRLILHPTQATRMRGDFRTGKRLNIKRIIPYIASSYKRDKIWMRRSVPSKRSYQVMLAIDDSKSMAESRSHELAFETLALVAGSLSVLEVGELSVVGFGDAMNVAHDFSTPFTADAGPHILQQFTFAQSKTNVQNLLSESIEVFRAARLKASGSAADLWQLQLIISDGICEDHPGIRQLIRQAHEERIMVVFIVVDPAALSVASATGMKQSILDLQTAEFVKDASGEMQLKMAKYLDTFPFRYYLIVRDVQDLPNVLAGALRQWFAETVDASG